jgi:hypothetical protein
MMRTLLLVATLVVIVSAHQEEINEDFAEASQAVQVLLQEGKSDSACRKLATGTKKEITDGQRNTQSLINRFDIGKNCHKAGLGAYNAAKTRQANAKRASDTAVRNCNKAKNARVTVGLKPLSAFKVGCSAFLNDRKYTSAKGHMSRTCNDAKRKQAAHADSKKATATALRAHQTAKKTCACRAQKNHKAAVRAAANFNSASNAKSWTKAYHMMCVLDGKPANRCSVPRVPRVSVPRMPTWVARTRCSNPKPKPRPKPRPRPRPAPARAGVGAPAGGAKQIAVSGSSFWAVNNADTIYAVANGKWKHIGGKLKQIAVSGNRVWGVNKNDDIFTRPGVGGSWKHIRGKLKSIEASHNGNRVWGVNKNDDIYTRPGVGGVWKHIGGKLKQIAVSGNRVWGVNKNDDIFTRPGVGGSWKRISGKLKQIAVSGNRVWGVNKNDDIFTRPGVGGNWKRISGKLKNIAVSGNRVWGVNSGNAAFSRNGVNGRWVHERQVVNKPKSSPLVCKTHVKGSMYAGVVRPSGAAGYTLVGGGMNNHYRSFNKLSPFEEAFPHGNQFQCDTGFGPGRLTCYARYCKKTGMRCTTNKTPRQRKSGVAVANAPRGYTMTGGGLYNHYRHFNKKAHFERSHPHSNGWIGDMGYGWGDYTVYARSCTKLSCRTVHSGVANAAHANCPRGYQVMSCGSHQMNGWGHLGAFEQYNFHGNGCVCDMGFGSGKQRCYARCCK